MNGVELNRPLSTRAIVLVGAGLMVALLLGWQFYSERTQVLLISSWGQGLQAEIHRGLGHLQVRIDGTEERVPVRMERRNGPGPVVYLFTVLADGEVLKEGTRIGAIAQEGPNGALLLCGESCEQLGLPTVWEARKG